MDFRGKKAASLCDTATRPAGGGQLSLWRIFRRKKDFGVRSLSVL